MKRLSTLMLVAVTLLLAASAWAQGPTEVLHGTVAQVDRAGRVVVLEDGRAVRVTGTTEIIVDSRSMSFETLKPGTRVSILDRPIVMQDSTAALVREPAPAQTTIIEVGARQPWCQGAWDPARGTNFGPCAAAK